MRIRPVVLAITAVLASGCREEEAAPFVFPLPIDTAAVTVQGGGASASLLVEVARDAEQRSIGLGLRPALDPESGMIFLFDGEQAGDNGFWMWRMHIPIDMAFLDSAGVVIHLFENLEPCADADGNMPVYPQACVSYDPGVPYWSVLETNQGWFAENGFGEGAVVTLEE
jgi:uncharacterized membrane protein (UPF0127 family)